MSQLVGAADPTLGYIALKDKRLVPTFSVLRRERDFVVERYSATQYPGGYSTPFWPGNKGFVGDGSTDYGMIEAVWSRSPARIAQGAASRVGFVGVTRDQYGAPLGGVTCSLFRTATREWIMDIVSDAGGNFLLQSWYSPDTHFIVFYKAGAPSVYAATDQILVGA